MILKGSQSGMKLKTFPEPIFLAQIVALVKENMLKLQRKFIWWGNLMIQEIFGLEKLRYKFQKPIFNFFRIFWFQKSKFQRRIFFDQSWLNFIRIIHQRIQKSTPASTFVWENIVSRKDNYITKCIISNSIYIRKLRFNFLEFYNKKQKS